jgi:hypothetical protein
MSPPLAKHLLGCERLCSCRREIAIQPCQVNDEPLVYGELSHRGWGRADTREERVGHPAAAAGGCWPSPPARRMSWEATRGRRPAVGSTPANSSQRWGLVVSLLTYHSRRWARLLTLLGVALAIAYLVLVTPIVSEVREVVLGIAAIGGVMLASIWYIWMGLVLRGAELGQTASATLSTG